MRRPPHRLQHVRARVLEGNVEIRQHAPLRHQRQDLIHMRIGIDVMEPHPGAERAERLGEAQEARLDGLRRATHSCA